MEKSNKRGKIPQSDWPLIMTRYEAGETLASIARTYDCSPPAISYVVSKSRARQPARDNPEASPSERESQLVKGSANESRRPRSVGARAPRSGRGRTARTRRPGPMPAARLRAQRFGYARDTRLSREIGGFVRDGFVERGSTAPAAASVRGRRKQQARAGWARAHRIRATGRVAVVAERGRHASQAASFPRQWYRTSRRFFRAFIPVTAGHRRIGPSPRIASLRRPRSAPPTRCQAVRKRPDFRRPDRYPNGRCGRTWMRQAPPRLPARKRPGRLSIKCYAPASRPTSHPFSVRSMPP